MHRLNSSHDFEGCRSAAAQPAQVCRIDVTGARSRHAHEESDEARRRRGVFQRRVDSDGHRRAPRLNVQRRPFESLEGGSATVCEAC
jgi:hypothetical protein